MIDSNLFADTKALDRNLHRGLRVDFAAVQHTRAAAMNAMFVAAAEFGDVCREYPIVFVEAGRDDAGKVELAPMAVFGLKQGENLMLAADGGWRAHYVPALLRGYPFGLARSDAQNYVVVIDAAHAAAPAGTGERVFDDAGEPTAALQQRRQLIETFEQETQRTRAACARLQELDLLRPMRFDATLPDGSTLGVDGFHTVAEERMAALTDAQIVEMHKNGLLGLIHAHQISLGLMRNLVERRLERERPAKSA